MHVLLSLSNMTGASSAGSVGVLFVSGTGVVSTGGQLAGTSVEVAGTSACCGTMIDPANKLEFGKSPNGSGLGTYACVRGSIGRP